MGEGRQRLSKQGEDFAAWLLEGLGHRVLERNVRTRYGEIDIVAHDADGTTVFVEVRVTTAPVLGGAVESLHRRKRSRVARQSTYYMAERGVTGPVRIDFMALELADGYWKTTYFKNAFGKGGAI